MECVGVDCVKQRVNLDILRKVNKGVQPGIVMGVWSVVSALAKHSTSESPDSDEARKAPNAEQNKQNKLMLAVIRMGTYQAITRPPVRDTLTQSVSRWDCDLSRTQNRA